MTQPNNLKAVGWGILMYPNSKHPYISSYGAGRSTEERAIAVFEEDAGLNYLEYQQKDKAIAKQLYVKE